MIRPGPANHITDVPGINVGHAQDEKAITGVTVVLPDQPAIAALDCRGGAPCTRETELLRPENLVEHVHAIVLSGGSAQGLEAASGVSDWLKKKNRGFPVVGGQVVPIVPSACIFDLNNGGDKSEVESGKYRQLGTKAVSNAKKDSGLGNFGAGIGTAPGPNDGMGAYGFISMDLFYELPFCNNMSLGFQYKNIVEPVDGEVSFSRLSNMGLALRIDG